MKLFRLTVDFAFKALFAQNPDLLLSLLNSFPQFQGQKCISSLKVLNPEIPKEMDSEKLSVLDISAEDINGNKFLVEMQAGFNKDFPKRPPLCCRHKPCRLKSLPLSAIVILPDKNIFQKHKKGETVSSAT